MSLSLSKWRTKIKNLLSLVWFSNLIDFKLYLNFFESTEINSDSQSNSVDLLIEHIISSDSA